MSVRPGQHVSGEGRIYHPYLATWREDVSEFPILPQLGAGRWMVNPSSRVSDRPGVMQNIEMEVLTFKIAVEYR